MYKDAYSEKITKIVSKCTKPNGWASFSDIGNLFRKKRVNYKFFAGNHKIRITGYDDLTECLLDNVKDIEIVTSARCCKINTNYK
jgi:hypothetical protein